MKNLIVFILCVFSLYGCVAYKLKNSIIIGDRNDAVRIAIDDFLTTKYSKNGKVFSMYFVDVGEDMYAFSLFCDDDYKYYITSVDTLGSSRLETRHIIKDSKLFYWADPNYGLNMEFIEALNQFDHIDSTGYTIQYIPEYVIDETEKGVDYYFCKDNLNKYKRVITSTGLGWYKPPRLKCRK